MTATNYNTSVTIGSNVISSLYFPTNVDIITLKNVNVNTAYFNLGLGSITCDANGFPLFPQDIITIGLKNCSGVAFFSTGSGTSTVNVVANSIW